METLAFFLFLLGIVIYFIPAMIAHNKEKRNAGAIFALNLLLGWTLLGWVAALVWSLMDDGKKNEQEIKK